MQISPFLTTSPINTPFNVESIAGKKLEEEKKDKVDKSQFKGILSKAIADVNNTHVVANEKIEGLIRGDEGIKMHDVMLSMQESQMSTQLLIEVRNKLYDCYKELSSISL